MAGAATGRGGAFDHFDLEVRGGLLGAVRLLVAAEDHAGGAQLIRFRWWPRCSYAGVTLAAVFAALVGGATLAQAWTAAVVLGVATAFLAVRMTLECAGASATIARALELDGKGAT